ncbi:hypothetical protein BST61_g3060 [Cercospora zeina]
MKLLSIFLGLCALHQASAAPVQENGLSIIAKRDAYDIPTTDIAARAEGPSSSLSARANENLHAEHVGTTDLVVRDPHSLEKRQGVAAIQFFVRFGYRVLSGRRYLYASMRSVWRVVRAGRTVTLIDESGNSLSGLYEEIEPVWNSDDNVSFIVEMFGRNVARVLVDVDVDLGTETITATLRVPADYGEGGIPLGGRLGGLNTGIVAYGNQGA